MLGQMQGASKAFFFFFVESVTCSYFIDLSLALLPSLMNILGERGTEEQ